MDVNFDVEAGNPASANAIGLSASDGAPSNRTAKTERRGLPLSVNRMVGLTTAAAMLGGQQHLAAALAIDPRSLRAKLTAERGVSDDDMLAAARALDARAARISEHAAKLRAEAGA